MQSKKEEETKSTETAEPSRVEVRGHDELEKLMQLIDVKGEEDAAQFALVDAALTDEMVKILRGHGHEECFYNIPYFTPRKSGGKTSWPACKLIKGGCSYEKGNKDHTHVVGVGYWGFVTAAQAYGRITLQTLDRPTVVEEADILYWATHVLAHDGHNGNKVDRWYYEEAMMETYKGLVDKPHADGISSSKCMRNVLAFLIPRKLISVWTADYLAGRAIMDPQRAIEMGFGNASKSPSFEPPKPATEPPASTPGGQAQTQTAKNLTAASSQLATQIGMPVEMLREYLESVHPRSVQRRLQKVTQALGDEKKANELSDALSTWVDAQAKDEPTELFTREEGQAAEQPATDAES